MTSTRRSTESSSGSRRRGDPAVFPRLMREFTTLGFGGRRETDLEAQRRADARTCTWLALAGEVWRSHPFAMRAVPTRPVDLPGDHQLYALLDSVRRKRRQGRALTNGEHEASSLYGAWIEKLLTAEESNAGTVETVLRAIGALEEADPADARAADLRTWLASVVLADLPPVGLVVWRDRTWLRAASFRLTRHESVCPTWLREGNRPPDFDPTAWDGGES